MIAKLYELIAALGYVHPLHPALTHAPIGGVMVAFFLALTALLLRKPALLTSAHHAVTVALVLLIPTVLAGILDWQQYYAGALLFPIQMKMALATLLFILLLTTWLLGRNPNPRPVLMLGLYTLCFLNVAGLGYFGGELVFGGRNNTHTHNTEQNYQAGETVFTSNCSGCHINGGNIIRPDLPLHSSKKLQNFDSFIAFIRDPKLPDGSKGPMPDFSAAKLTEQQARDLYDYVIHKLAKNPTPE